MILYLTSSSLTKISILVFYLRILVAKKDKLITKITLVAMILYYIVLLLILILQCRFVNPLLQPKTTTNTP